MKLAPGIVLLELNKEASEGTVEGKVKEYQECFHEKDYLNYRYHAKRCLYLCLLKRYLETSPSIGKVKWSTLQNEARKPLLIVYPAAKLAEVPGLFVRIIPSAMSLFSISKLNLKRNNIHNLNHALEATPKYNCSILEDMFLEDTEFINKFFLGWKDLREALIVLKVWAQQRSSLYMHDCLNGFLIAVIMAYLATKKQINHSMKAIQIIRVTLNFIAASESWSRGLYFPKEGQSNITKEEKMQLKELFPVVICNPSGGLNLAFRMSRNGLTQLQDEAALALKCMEKGKDGGFEELFMTKIDFAVKYDYCIRINLKGKQEVYALGFCLDDECWRSYEEKIHGILAKGLNDRAKFIRVTWRNTQPEWSVDDGLSVHDKEPLFIGISVTALEKAFRMVDIGPNVESKGEANEFRKFWGDKSELRRFKDGRIAESTVWESEPWARHLVLKRIAQHVLSRQLSLSEENIVVVVDQLDFSLLHGAGDPVSYSGSLLGAFDVLSKRLRLIEDLPLKVSSVQPLDSAFRFTSVFPPEPHLLAKEKIESQSLRLNKLIPSCIQPLEVMILLEGSGNWPMDEIAIEKTKQSFLIQIGESLQKMWGMTCTATEDNVDVLMSGYAFRLKILHERGLSLLKKDIGIDQPKRVHSTDKKLFIRSQHASMINGLQSRYPIYGPVVRLAQRWAASHLFSTCLVEEVVELLVAYLFVYPLPFDAPCSRITGFLRFLRLLSQYDWTFSPLVVDINNDLSQSDEKEINDNFLLRQKAQGDNGQSIGPTMFLATVYDKASEAWTGSSPSALELKRLVAYARSSADLLTKLVLQDQIGPYRWECLFRTPLNNYDAIILLHKDKLAYPQRLLFPSEVDQGKHVARGHASKCFQPFLLPRDLKGKPEELKNKLLVDFDPSRCFIRDIEKEFPTKFKVWHDSLGGDVIGLTWGGSYSSKKRKQDVVVEEGYDPCDVLKSVGEVGKGFVRSIYFLKAPRVTN